MKKTSLLALPLTIALIAGCASLSPNQSLYQRIGGQEVLSSVVSETIDKTSSDPRTKRSFDGIKLTKLKESITNQLCQLTGGGCNYEGDTMQKSHADAKISTAEFELMVQNLRDALDHQHVGTREKNELLKILAPMKRDIVTN
ncbi:MAG TPA: group 1 truncated hemoglobin [Methylophilaceae bacterium]|jgi:hemoglobin